MRYWLFVYWVNMKIECTKSDKKIQIPFITGPTAVGKSSIAIEIAKELGYEIISCDSRQIYKYMNIGTAKPSKKELNSVNHHLIDIKNPDEKYSAFQFATDALKIIRDCAEIGKSVLLCGGTGLYFEALSQGVGPQVETDTELIEFYTKIAEHEGRESVFNKLKQVDPESANRLHKNDLQRVIRALAVYKQTGVSLQKLQNRKSPPSDIEFHTYTFLLDREKLYEKINSRVDKMVSDGLYEEFLTLLKMGYTYKSPGLRSVGYQEFFNTLDSGAFSIEDAVTKIKQASRKYAKRQSTWLKNRVAGELVDVEKSDFKTELLNKIKNISIL